VVNIGEYKVHYIGPYKDLFPILDNIVKLGKSAEFSAIDNTLNKSMAPSAVIMESDSRIIAFTDHFGCYPLFYSDIGGGIISNNAHKINQSIGSSDWNILSAEEFIMSGYVSGSDTLIQGIKRMQSGERVIIDSSDNSFNIARYYRYNSLPQDNGRSDSDWIDELDSIMNNITKRMIMRADGRVIKVPLSAGLDSRLLVCKLHEFGYNNLETFSYGPPGNWEARGAKIVADKLNLPWNPVVVGRKEARKLFYKQNRKDYWSFADGLSALPNFNEYYPILKMQQSGGLTKETIIINGQSGDFITGGHIPVSLTLPNANIHTLLYEIVNKHYALWKNLMTKDRLERIKLKVLSLLDVDINSKLSSNELIALYERWECEERQTKWVIHGQRVYDFFGYDWQLPLWDIELVRFFQRVPNRLKFEQRLYRLWLEKWNYNKLFLKFDPVVWRWPGASLSVVPLAKVIELAFGKNAKNSWYELFYYWGHTTEQYAPYSYKDYYKLRKDIRNSIALNGLTWAQENSLPTELVNIKY